MGSCFRVLDAEPGQKEHDTEWRPILSMEDDRKEGVLEPQITLLTGKPCWPGRLKYCPELSYTRLRTHVEALMS